MIETVNPHENRTDIEALNTIAANWSERGGLPDGVTDEQVKAICQPIAEHIEDTVEGLKDNTTFSEFEAYVWALDNLVDEDHRPLSPEAMTIYLSVMGGTDGWLSPESIENNLDSARSKLDEAREMVGEITFPDRDEVLQSPQIVWLSDYTVYLLRSLAEEDESTLDEVVSRLADEAKTVVSIREFALAYLDWQGRDTVAQLAVGSETLDRGPLYLVSHTADPGKPLPEIVTETDAVEVGGQQFDFTFEESPDGPNDRYVISLYVSEDVQGMGSVDLETGLDDLEAAMSETTVGIRELVEIARDRMDAKVVTAEGSHQDQLLIQVFFDPESPPGTDRFHHIEEIQIADDAYEATVQRRYEVPENLSGSVIWRSGEIEGKEPVKFENGIESFQTGSAGGDHS